MNTSRLWQTGLRAASMLDSLPNHPTNLRVESLVTTMRKTCRNATPSSLSFNFFLYPPGLLVSQLCQDIPGVNLFFRRKRFREKKHQMQKRRFISSMEVDTRCDTCCRFLVNARVNHLQNVKVKDGKFAGCCVTHPNSARLKAQSKKEL